MPSFCEAEQWLKPLICIHSSAFCIPIYEAVLEGCDYFDSLLLYCFDSLNASVLNLIIIYVKTSFVFIPLGQLLWSDSSVSIYSFTGEHLLKCLLEGNSQSVSKENKGNDNGITSEIKFQNLLV